ncbi:hypothetical protein DZB84_18490 [Bacillus sp. HNG]|uniref:hypothetical protein n=1 Tax=Bacillus sp. HNG TaxID=2293325 RepID=UPI000E2F15FC|nr:hypothetical protein [Bacillus sp. HNG]RFB12738.1 hypothetical protein DZB84_18490 [Bacillus sp. HNG]
MRVREGKNLSKVYNSDFPSNMHNPDISCHEVYQLKNKCSGNFVNPTEPIIVQLLSNYLTLNESGERDGMRLLWGPIYKGGAGNNQEIDISIEYDGKIIFGISIKSQFGGGYLENADLVLPLIQDYKDTIKKFEYRGSVSDVLQDMARIQNIKESTDQFESITILYSKVSKKKWTEKFSTGYSHSYLFLEDNQRSFFQELEEKLPNLKSFKRNFKENYGVVTANSTGKGRAIKGSRLHLQNYVNDNQGELNELILMSSPSLLAFLDKELSIEWKSPLRRKDYHEYRNELLDVLDDWMGKREELEKYWAKIGPQWDGIAIVKGKNGQIGLLLVEAKAHLQEMQSKIQAGDISKVKIEQTIEEVKTYVGSNAPLEIWLEQYYQLSNRLAYLHILNEKIGIPTWLILVNFADDHTHKPTQISAWIEHYRSVFSKMDISSSSAIFKQIITIYPVLDCK